jgi:hypothetical protein
VAGAKLVKAFNQLRLPAAAVESLSRKHGDLAMSTSEIEKVLTVFQGSRAVAPTSPRGSCIPHNIENTIPKRPMEARG